MLDTRDDRSYFLAFTLMGGLFGLVVAGLTGPPRAAALEIDMTYWLLLNLFFGSLIGIFCAPIGIFCFQRKSFSRAIKILIITTLPATAAGALMFPSPLVAFIPGVTFLIGMAVLRTRLPDLPQFPQCLNCGYNLTGNTSGTCPECGSRMKGESDAN